MFNSQVVKDRSGQHYIIRLRNQGHQNLPVQPEKFHNTQISYQFVTHLQSPFGLWQNIASSNSFFSLQRWQASNPSLSIEHYAAEVLVQGFVEVYKTADVMLLNQQARKNRFKDNAGKLYQIQPAISLLSTSGADVKAIAAMKDAQQFVLQMDLTPDAADEMVETLQLTGEGTSAEIITTALKDGELVITHIPERKQKVTTDYVEESVSAVDAAPAPAIKAEPAKVAPESDERAEDGSADALMKAAEEGTPFCEECEKNKDAA